MKGHKSNQFKVVDLMCTYVPTTGALTHTLVPGRSLKYVPIVCKKYLTIPI